MESFELKETFSAKPGKIYKAWLNSKMHSEIIGDNAKINAKLNGKFVVWDGYITGSNVELIPDKKIVQNWRTTEFDEDDPDSILEIYLDEVDNCTQLTMVHKNIPDGQGDDYKKGWIDYYFEPMKKYFRGK
jgi:activator of HSP90 ATPase